MAQGDKTKKVAFQMWKEGKRLAQIQQHIGQISTTLTSSVKGWVVDWERGNQGIWIPKLD